MLKNLVVAIFVILLSFACLRAQVDNCVQNQYKFKYLTIDQGLSNNNIRSICQDSKGFIWFATQNGLNKYNGQTITTYWHDPNDSTSLSSNGVNIVFLDSKNQLWAGAGRGLNRYDANLDKFMRFNHAGLTVPIDEIYTVAEDKEQKLWFGGTSGLYCYNLISGEIIHYSNKMGNTNGLPHNLIYKILVDKNNKVWVSVLNEGLYVLDQNTGTHKVFRNNPEDSTSISGNRIEKLYEDRNGNIWAGTLNEGVNLYKPESQTFERFIPDSNNTYSTRVRAIFEDLKGNLYLGTRSGLYVFDKTLGKFSHYASEENNFSKLSQNSVIESFIDKSGTLWIGTFSGGVNYTYLNKKEFTHYIAGKNDNRYLSGSNIYAITEDDKGNLWIGGDNGLDYLDRNSYTFKYYKSDANNPNSISYNDIKALEWDKKGNLWIGTNLGGLNHYNVKTGRFTRYKHNANDPGSIAGDKIYCLLCDKNNNLWIILNSSNDFQFLNIDVLPDGQDKFIHLKEKSYFGFDQNSNGDVFIGGINGFWTFTRRDSTFRFVEKSQFISNVNTIRIDSKSKIWIGSSLGLTRYNPNDQSFMLFSKSNGHPIDEVYGILEDASGSLWVSTNSGLVKITNVVNNTSDVQFKVYNNHDGLQSKQFNYNAFYKCRSGEMVFGGINGFNTFFPDKIVENRIPAAVVLTDLKLFNKSVMIGENIGGRIILNKSISFTDEITLGPKQNIFTIEFATLQNANPEMFVFKTKLVGLDEDWQLRKPGNNQVTYTNLAPGNYTFMVSAANNDGFWSEEPLMLKIVVEPPIWGTWSFRILAPIVVILLILSVYYYRVRAIKQKNIDLEKTVNSRTQEILEKNNLLVEANSLLYEKQEEIVTQNEELEKHRNNLSVLVAERTVELEIALEKAKESDALKSTFLANMSHEIRTPMNAIVGFSNFLNDTDASPEERNQYVHIIQSNSNMLLKIIDEILDLSLIESKQMKLSNAVFELNMMLDHLYSYYSLNNNNPNVEVLKNNWLEPQNLKLNSDETRFKQIMTNLMDNACKFTPSGTIELGARIEHGLLVLWVKDTGRGIPQNEMGKVFQQFTKVEDDQMGWTSGIGLGLAIAQKTAEALGGHLTADSQEGKGSTFTFIIPMEGIGVNNTEPPIDHPEQPTVNLHGKSILIAEDIEANYLYLEKMLKKTHANVLWAHDGKEAVEIFKNSGPIHLILMDIKMPHLNGYDAAKLIRSIKPDQLIVAQTAYARPQEKFKFYDANFDDYISKPISQSDLIGVLKRFF
jgi:signal transduction histidine kinase/ligand-binding sensor domain-containing protein/CheY-like chemotaxis protein